MEIGLLCQTTLENCLREDLLVAFNMLMSMVKGRRKQKAVFPHTRLRNSFVSLVSCRVRGGVCAKEPWNPEKYCSRLSISKYTESQRNALPRSSQK